MRQRKTQNETETRVCAKGRQGVMNERRTCRRKERDGCLHETQNGSKTEAHSGRALRRLIKLAIPQK